jgi:hypothetical protein
MTETDLLQTIGASYRMISPTPALITNTLIPGLTKLSVRVFSVNEDNNPPLGDDHLVDYYVIDRGLETEAAFLSIYDVSVVDKVAAEVATKISIGSGAIKGEGRV